MKTRRHVSGGSVRTWPRYVCRRAHKICATCESLLGNFTGGNACRLRLERSDLHRRHGSVEGQLQDHQPFDHLVCLRIVVCGPMGLYVLGLHANDQIDHFPGLISHAGCPSIAGSRCRARDSASWASLIARLTMALVNSFGSRGCFACLPTAPVTLRIVAHLVLSACFRFLFRQALIHVFRR